MLYKAINEPYKNVHIRKKKSTVLVAAQTLNSPEVSGGLLVCFMFNW